MWFWFHYLLGFLGWIYIISRFLQQTHDFNVNLSVTVTDFMVGRN